MIQIDGLSHSIPVDLNDLRMRRLAQGRQELPKLLSRRGSGETVTCFSQHPIGGDKAYPLACELLHRLIGSQVQLIVAAQ